MNIIKEKVSNIIGNQQNKTIRWLNTKNHFSHNISKNDAIGLCHNKGLSVSGNITFASINDATGKYWANPYVRFLYDDWWLLLNDKYRGQLHVLFIPSGSINESEIKVRADKPYLIDLLIENDINYFEETKSKLRLRKYFKITLEY